MKEEQQRIQEFINYLALERRLSPYTLRNYSQAITRFFNWARSNQWDGRINVINSKIVRDFVIESQRTLSRRTLHNHISALRTFYRYLLKRKAVMANPFQGLVLPKLRKSLPKFLTEFQIRELLGSPMRLLDNERSSPFQAWRDRLVLELLYGGGLRVSELVSLNYGMVDNDSGVARIWGKGNKERLCPLGKVAHACLTRFREEFAPQSTYDSPVLVSDSGKRMTVRQVQKLVKRYLAIAGLPMDMSPHKIRHSYATHLINNGADLRIVQDLLGHASLSTTQIYTHIGIARLKQVHQGAHPRA